MNSTHAASVYYGQTGGGNNKQKLSPLAIKNKVYFNALHPLKDLMFPKLFNQNGSSEQMPKGSSPKANIKFFGKKSHSVKPKNGKSEGTNK